MENTAVALYESMYFWRKLCREGKLLQNQLDVWGVASSFVLLLKALQTLVKAGGYVSNLNPFTENHKSSHSVLFYFQSQCYVVKVSPCPHPTLGFCCSVSAILYFSHASHAFVVTFSHYHCRDQCTQVALWNEAFNLSPTFSWNYPDEFSKEQWTWVIKISDLNFIQIWFSIARPCPSLISKWSDD